MDKEAKNKHDWPNCKEVQCEQAHEALRTVMQLLNIECDDGIYVVGKAIRIANAIGDLKVHIAQLNTALARRNEIEGKAHALFTEPLKNGQHFAHLPEQCNPLGFVQVMRAAFEKMADGKPVSNPFILMPDE